METSAGVGELGVGEGGGVQTDGDGVAKARPLGGMLSAVDGGSCAALLVA